MFILTGILISSVLLSALLALITKRIDPLRDFWRVVAAVILSNLGCLLAYLFFAVLLLDWIGTFGASLGALVAGGSCYYFVVGWLFDLATKQRILVTWSFILTQILWSLTSHIVL